MSIGKDKLVLDPANFAEGDHVASYVTAADGTLITKTTDGAKERLDVSTGAEHDHGSAFTAADKGTLALALDPSSNYANLKVNAAGELLVAADISVTTGSDKIEDSAHASGDVGAYVLSVREDVLTTSTSASGDYQSFKTDSLGRLWTVAEVTVTPPNTAVLATAATVGTSAVALPATALTARKRILIENIGTRPIFIGDSAVTIASGVRVSAGSTWETELGPTAVLYAIAAAAGQDVRVLEIA
jgi:hypothetical protein